MNTKQHGLDTPMTCPIRRKHDEVNRQFAGEIDRETLASADIGPCSWFGMTAEEIDEVMSDSSGGCANPAHRFFLQRLGGMPDE